MKPLYTYLVVVFTIAFLLAATGCGEAPTVSVKGCLSTDANGVQTVVPCNR